MFFLILLAGDIESNPRPDMLDHSSDDNISNSSTYDISIFEHFFSIVQYNIQSLMGKVDQLQIELLHFDVIALTETWLSETVSTDEIMFQNYQVPIRKDRITNSYGGVIVYVKDNIPCKRRLDLEIDGVDAYG